MSHAAKPYVEILAEFASARPHEECLAFDEERLTWRELELRSNRLARSLKASGVKARDFVMIALKNEPLFIVATFACWKVGATPSVVSYRLTDKEFISITELLKPSALVLSEQINWDGQPPRVKEDASQSSAPLELDETMVSQPWKAMTSGGSTGRPKVIVLSAPPLFVPEVSRMDLPENGVVLCPGPLYHNAPFTVTIFALLRGNKVVVMKRFDAAQTLEHMERHRVNWVLLVPTMMHRIWKLGMERLATCDLSSLKTVMHMAAACPVWLKQNFIDWLGPERVLELYGGTEGIGVTIINGREWLAHRGSVGKPYQETRIYDENGAVLPAGEVGEIYFRKYEGEPIYKYLGAEPKQREIWESLGDMGYLDEEGYLYIVDRRTDMIVSGGVNIYPAEVEAAIESHSAVVGAVAIGLPDEDLGNRVHALVQVGEGVSTKSLREELLAHLEGELTKPKWPRSFEFVTEALRDDAGKVRRSQLRQERLNAN